MRYRNGAANRQPQPNDMRRSTTDGRNDQLRHWLADGNLDVAVADFTGMRPAWSWWISIRNVWCWSSRTRCDWISPAAGRRRMRPPSAPVTCHPWSAARSCWQSAGHRRTHRRHAVPPSRIRSRGCGPGTSYAISFGISACDYRWSAVDDFIDCARRSISTIDRHDSGRNRRITPDSR